MKRFAWAVLLLAVVATSGLRAEEPLAAGQPLALAIKAAVQEELKLTPEQVAAIKSLYQNASKDEKLAVHDALAKALKPEQKKRLQEISVQVRGGSAVADPEVIKALGLSEKQARQVAEYWKNKEEDLRQILRITRFKNAEAKRKFILSQRKDAGKELLKMLTEEQEARFKKLEGKRIETKGLDS